MMLALIGNLSTYSGLRLCTSLSHVFWAPKALTRSLSHAGKQSVQTPPTPPCLRRGSTKRNNCRATHYRHMTSLHRTLLRLRWITTEGVLGNRSRWVFKVPLRWDYVFSWVFLWHCPILGDNGWGPTFQSFGLCRLNQLDIFLSITQHPVPKLFLCVASSEKQLL